MSSIFIRGTPGSGIALGLYWNVAAESTAIFFVLSMISLLVCAVFYIREVTLALRSVQDEVHDLFMHTRDI